MIGIPLTPTQLEFIFENKGKMKQKDIAAAIKVTPACVCKVLRPKAKVIPIDGNFDIEDFKKCYRY